MYIAIEKEEKNCNNKKIDARTINPLQSGTQKFLDITPVFWFVPFSMSDDNNKGNTNNNDKMTQ